MACEVVKTGGRELKSCIAELFHKLGFSPHGKVFIKPNLCARDSLRKSENTNVDFLASLIDVLLDNKCKITIGHPSLLGTLDLEFPFEQIMKTSNFQKLAKIPDVTLLNLDSVPVKKIKSGEITFDIPKIIDDVDHYINLAKMKTHMQTGVTLSLKNQMGLLSKENRMDIHKLSLGKYIAHLGKIVKPDLSIIDGVVAMEGNGPHHGEDKPAKLILAGDDMVELDSLAVALMGLDLRLMRHIVNAQSLGAGKFADKDMIKLHKNKQLKFRPAVKYFRKGLKLFVWPSSACSGCIVALDEAGKRLRKGLSTGLKMFRSSYLFRTDILIGDCADVDVSKMRRVVGIGKCAKEFCEANKIDHYGDCPISSHDVYDYLKKKF